MAEPKNPAVAKMRDWPMFRHPAGKRQHKTPVLDGRTPPHIAELVMALVPGGPLEKLEWLREQVGAGRLDGDDPEEVAQAENLLSMLARIGGSKGGKEKRHLDELLDEGLKETFPASDPVSVGHFTSTEPPSQPIYRAVRRSLRCLRRWGLRAGSQIRIRQTWRRRRRCSASSRRWRRGVEVRGEMPEVR